MAMDNYADYDCGLINDFGGGDVDWWQDYIRSEIGRANDFWRAQVGSIDTTAVEERIKRLEEALRMIENVAGNIPDDLLCRATGANDARYRGGLVCTARDIARAALKGEA